MAVFRALGLYSGREIQPGLRGNLSYYTPIAASGSGRLSTTFNPPEKHLEHYSRRHQAPRRPEYFLNTRKVLKFNNSTSAKRMKTPSYGPWKLQRFDEERSHAILVVQRQYAVFPKLVFIHKHSFVWTNHAYEHRKSFS